MFVPVSKHMVGCNLSICNLNPYLSDLILYSLPRQNLKSDFVSSWSTLTVYQCDSVDIIL